MNPVQTETATVWPAQLAQHYLLVQFFGSLSNALVALESQGRANPPVTDPVLMEAERLQDEWGRLHQQIGQAEQVTETDLEQIDRLLEPSANLLDAAQQDLARALVDLPPFLQEQPLLKLTGALLTHMQEETDYVAQQLSSRPISDMPRAETYFWHRHDDEVQAATGLLKQSLPLMQDLFATFDPRFQQHVIAGLAESAEVSQRQAERMEFPELVKRAIEAHEEREDRYARWVEGESR